MSEGVVVDNFEPDITDDSHSQVSIADSDQTQASIDDSLMELGEDIFKVPQKRKRPRVKTNSKKKYTLSDVSDAESESDFSDCSVTCSLRQSGFASRIYTVDDIRAFLKETKHARNVRIDDFFP